jgi:hypothetical protein
VQLVNCRCAQGNCARAEYSAGECVLEACTQVTPVRHAERDISHRSHFGSRYTLGYCCKASLLPRLDSRCRRGCKNAWFMQTCLAYCRLAWFACLLVPEWPGLVACSAATSEHLQLDAKHSTAQKGQQCEANNKDKQPARPRCRKRN